MFTKMLIPVDGSPHSKRATEAAVDLAKRLQASVYLLHVIRNLSLPVELMEMIAAGEITESRMEILQNSAEIILDNARRNFEEAGFAESHPLLILTEKQTGRILIVYTEGDD